MDFEVAASASKAQISLACTGWYTAWLNGILLAHGPPREASPWQYYDLLDLRPHLKPGVNRIRIRACHYGVDTQSQESGQPGLLVAGFLHENCGLRLVDFGRRELWRAARSPSIQNTPWRLNSCLAFGEHADLTLDPAVWLSAPPDNSWAPPLCISRHPLPGREKMIRSDLPPLVGNIHSAQRIPGPHGWQVWDFGGQVFGFIEMQISAGAPGACEILHGERLTRLGLPDWQFGGGNFRELLKLPSGSRRWESFEKRSLRYLALPDSFDVRELCIRESHLPLKEVWGPRASHLNAREHKIVAAAARTVTLCADDLLNDCPRRERAQYFDPADYMESFPVLFGTWDPVRRWFLQFIKGADQSGALRMCYPSPSGKPVIPDFSIAFISALNRYASASGDVDTTRACFPAALAALKAFQKHADTDLLLSRVPGWVFLCNSFELAKHPRSASLNAIWSEGWKAAGELSELLRLPGAGEYFSRAAEIRASWRRTFWRNSQLLDCDLSAESQTEKWWNYHRDADRGRFADPGEAACGFGLNVRWSLPIHAISVCAPGKIRLWCEGQLIGEAEPSNVWAHPHPFEPSTFELPHPATELLVEAAPNDVDREVFLRARGANPVSALAGELPEQAFCGWHDVLPSCTKPAMPRLWSIPRFNQITAGYSAGMLESTEARDLLRSCLREHYHVPWMKRTTPVICTPTEDSGLILNRSVLCNTPHSLSHFCRALAEHGMRDEARRLCIRLFGAMIDAGSDTLWEEFAPRSSLCHGWGAFAATYLLGDDPAPATAMCE